MKTYTIETNTPRYKLTKQMKRALTKIEQGQAAVFMEVDDSPEGYLTREQAEAESGVAGIEMVPYRMPYVFLLVSTDEIETIHG